MSAGFANMLKGLSLVVLVAGLGACREDEQDRPLHYEQGVYGGKKDTPLTAEQQRELELRGRKQNF